MSLLWRIERKVIEGKVTASRLGRDTVNDPRLVHDMRRGRMLRPSTIAKVVRYLDRLEGKAR